MPVPVTAKFLGVLNIPLLYNDIAPFQDGSILNGAFSPVCASDVCEIRTAWTEPTSKSQYAYVRRYISATPNQSVVVTYGGPDTGSNFPGPHNYSPSVLLGAYLTGFSGNLQTGGYFCGTAYCADAIDNVGGFTLTTPYGADLKETDPFPLPGNEYFDLNQFGTMECALYVWRSSFRVITIINGVDNQPPEMIAWSPQASIEGFISFFGQDQEGHLSQEEYTLGNSPDYSNGINYTLYCDNQADHTPADTNFYISKWFWNPFVGPPEITEELYSQIVWGDPDFPFTTLNYQKVASVTGGFIFHLGAAYTYQGNDFWHAYLSRDGSEYYLLNAVWLFNGGTNGIDPNTEFSNASTVSYARDKHGIWFACVTDDASENYVVGTSDGTDFPFYQLYDPSNINVKALPCFNPCTTFPMYEATK